MSVAAMTMDDQRPLMNSYDKMSKQCQQNTLHAADAGGGGAPPSGPASPTPSGSEEPAAVHQFHHTHHHHAHHHHQHHHARHQQQVPSHLSAEQQQKQQSPPLPSTAAAVLPSHHHNQQQLQQPQSSTVAEAVAAVEHRQRLLEEEIESLKLEQTRLSQQCADAQRREKILMRRLANKEQEFQDYVSQIAEYKAAQAPTALALRSALLDPAVNLLFEKLKKELKATKAKLEETQNELSAWKFTPDSNTGKRLMAKCRLLYQENEELGKMTSNGRLAKLETELAMQKSFCEEVKKSQSELDDFLPELDEDVEGMQSTILFLQQELKTTRDRIQVLEKENCQLKSGTSCDPLKEVETDNSTNSLHSSLNGTIADATAAVATATAVVADIDAIPYKNVNSSSGNNLQQFHTSTTALNSKDGKFPAIALETIDENAVARNFASSKEFYNGKEPEQLATAPTVLDEVSNGSSYCAAATVATVAAVAVAAPIGVLRTVASRKRNFDGDSNEKLVSANTPTAPAAVLMHVAAPRTLPPKKSKLRRASVQSTELNEFENCGAQPPIAGNAVSGAPSAEVLNIVDNAVAGMANEENPAVVLTADEPMDGGVAQRIMTRRRSVRTQQNGGDGVH